MAQRLDWSKKATRDAAIKILRKSTSRQAACLEISKVFKHTVNVDQLDATFRRYNLNTPQSYLAKAEAPPPPPPEKPCVKCEVPGGSSPADDSDIQRGFDARPDGRPEPICRVCKAALERRRKEERDRRVKSDFEALTFDDMDDDEYDVSVANDRRTARDGKAAAEKRQEFNRNMGEIADALATTGGDPDAIDPKLGTYAANLAEQERRFSNRRMARSVSISLAHEALALRLFKQAAMEYLADKVVPTGYALKPHGLSTIKRDVIIPLSDLHLGAELDAASNPIAYRAVEEARRLEWVLREALDYKPQYREHSRARILINGDVIEGMLLHDQRAGAPLTEQKAVFWHHMSRFIGHVAQVYPNVDVECQPGNHGRDKLRHPGRATEFKWDGVEWQMYYALMMMCRQLKNVRWSLPFRAVSIVDLFGAKMLMSHGDTEVKIGDPDTQAARNAQMLERVNSSRQYGCEFQVATFGHFHKSRNQGGNVIKIFNGCLVPPNGHARGEGYIGEPCSQTIWEAVEGHPVGDYRRIEVGPTQDKDEKLGTLIPPFRFDLNDPKANAAVMP